MLGAVQDQAVANGEGEGREYVSSDVCYSLERKMFPVGTADGDMPEGCGAQNEEVNHRGVDLECIA